MGASLFGLAPCGVLPATRVTTGAVRSYRTFSPLPGAADPKAHARALVSKRTPGGVFSVPLSFGLPRPGITRRTALRSSDFPPVTAWFLADTRSGRRSSGSLQLVEYSASRLCLRSGGGGLAVGLLRDVVALEFLIEIAAGSVDDLGGLGNVPAVLTQS